MYLDLAIIILCVNALLGFLAYGMDNAQQINYFSKNFRYKSWSMSLYKEILLIICITLISSIIGFWFFVIEIKAGDYKYGLRYFNNEF